MLEIDYVNYLLFRFIIRSPHLSAFIDFKNLSINEMKWFDSEEDAEILIKNSFFKKLLQIYKHDVIFIMCRKKVVNLIKKCFQIISTNVISDKLKKRPYFYLFDKNKHPDPNIFNDLKKLLC